MSNLETLNQGQKLPSEGFSVAERMSVYDLSPAVESLVELEKEVPVVVGVDVSLRPKIIDNCGMACVFCHNEGTPVASAHFIQNKLLLPNPTYRGGRVSIFENTNGVNFIPGVMQANESFAHSLNVMHRTLGLEELHLTGGGAHSTS